LKGLSFKEVLLVDVTIGEFLHYRRRYSYIMQLNPLLFFQLRYLSTMMETTFLPTPQTHRYFERRITPPVVALDALLRAVESIQSNNHP